MLANLIGGFIVNQIFEAAEKSAVEKDVGFEGELERTGTIYPSETYAPGKVIEEQAQKLEVKRSFCQTEFEDDFAEADDNFWRQTGEAITAPVSYILFEACAIGEVFDQKWDIDLFDN